MKLWKWLKRQFIGPYIPLDRPQFLTDPELELRQLVARDLMGEAKVVPLRKTMVLENPDYVADWPRDGTGAPIDDDFAGPIG